MADICKCLNEMCPIKNKCYRHTAPSDEYLQSVCGYKFEEDEEGNVVCDHFWSNK